jgi:UDP-glucose 4-epimerase
MSSGGTVYGVPKTRSIPETHPTDPLCSYGITKLMTEKYLALFHHERGLDYRVLRPGNAYGERQPLHRHQGAVGVFLSQLAAGQPIEIWGDGQVVRDYVYAGDIAEALVRAATVRDDSARVFNIGSGAGTSLLELVEEMRHVTGVKPTVIMRPSRSFDIPANVLDIALAKKVLGWTPAVPLRDGLCRAWHWIRGNRSAA